MREEGGTKAIGSMTCCRHATGPPIRVASDTSNYRFVRQIGLKTLFLWRTVLNISSYLNFRTLVLILLLLNFIEAYILRFFYSSYHIFIDNFKFHCKVNHILAGAGAAIIYFLIKLPLSLKISAHAYAITNLLISCQCS